VTLVERRVSSHSWVAAEIRVEFTKQSDWNRTRDSRASEHLRSSRNDREAPGESRDTVNEVITGAAVPLAITSDLERSAQQTCSHGFALSMVVPAERLAPKEDRLSLLHRVTKTSLCAPNAHCAAGVGKLESDVTGVHGMSPVGESCDIQNRSERNRRLAIRSLGIVGAPGDLRLTSASGSASALKIDARRRYVRGAGPPRQSRGPLSD